MTIEHVTQITCSCILLCAHVYRTPTYMQPGNCNQFSRCHLICSQAQAYRLQVRMPTT